MVTFDLPSGPGNFELCVRKAVEQNNRRKLMKCLAAHRVVPVKNQWSETSLGKTIANFERRGNPKPKIPDGTRDVMIKVLEIEKGVDIEHARRKIKNQPEWGEEA